MIPDPLSVPLPPLNTILPVFTVCNLLNLARSVPLCDIVLTSLPVSPLLFVLACNLPLLINSPPPHGVGSTLNNGFQSIKELEFPTGSISLIYDRS